MRRNRPILVAVTLLLAACTTATPTSTASSVTTTSAIASTTVVPTTAAPSTTLAPTTTVATTTTTTTTIPLSVDTIDIDLAVPCSVVRGWLAYAALSVWEETWALTHPFSQTGPPLGDAPGGYGSFDSPAYQDETALTASVTGAAVECSFFEFGSSYGESVGVATVTGDGDTGPGALGMTMRTESGQWKVDNFASHVRIVSPDPFEEADERVVLATPSGTFDTLVIVDGSVVTVSLVENPDDPEEAIGTWVPAAPLAPGDHVVTVASMLENGVLAAKAVRWVVP